MEVKLRWDARLRARWLWVLRALNMDDELLPYYRLVTWPRIWNRRWDARPRARKLMKHWLSLTRRSHNWLFRHWELNRNMWSMRESGSSVDVILNWDARPKARRLRLLRVDEWLRNTIVVWNDLLKKGLPPNA